MQIDRTLGYKIAVIVTIELKCSFNRNISRIFCSRITQVTACINMVNFALQQITEFLFCINEPVLLSLAAMLQPALNLNSLIMSRQYSIAMKMGNHR